MKYLPILCVCTLFLTGCQDEAAESKEQKYKTISEKGCAHLSGIAYQQEALEGCLKEASEGSVTAEVTLADWYKKKLQWNEAIQWYEAAAKHGDHYAQYQLAKAYLDGHIKKEETLALFWLDASANGGYSPSQLILAKFYQKGMLVKQNDHIAFQWYMTCASEQPEAAFEVGHAYLTGQLGQEKNLELAIQYLTDAATHGHLFAKAALENINVQSKKSESDILQKELKSYKDAALKGSREAQLQLAKLLMKYSIPQYDKVALHWLSQAAMGGNEEAQYLLGQCYYEGIGTGVDYRRAFKIFSELALNGNVLSQYYVGKMYYEGQGIERDVYLGKKFMMMSAEQGMQEAQTLLALWGTQEWPEREHVDKWQGQGMPIDANSMYDLSESDHENIMDAY